MYKVKVTKRDAAVASGGVAVGLLVPKVFNFLKKKWKQRLEKK